MRIERAIESIHALPAPGGWARLENVFKAHGGLELYFTIHKEDRGRGKIGGWNITCQGVREAQITDFDGGGLAVYGPTHPAARQYLARRAELRWLGDRDRPQLVGVLYQAHNDAVNDWIPFDRYVSIRTVSADRCVLRGPHFLLRTYAGALRSQGVESQLTLRTRVKAKAATKLRVLHFGASFVVAAGFQAERRSSAFSTPVRS
jgi:hypothetical protein